MQVKDMTKGNELKLIILFNGNFKSLIRFFACSKNTKTGDLGFNYMAI